MSSIIKRDKNSYKVDTRELIKWLKSLLETDEIDVVHIAAESLLEEIDEKAGKV